MRLQAAEGKVTELMGQIKLRGCKEEFVPDPAQLQEGKVSLSIRVHHMFCSGMLLDQTEIVERDADGIKTCLPS